MSELDEWLENADAISYFEGLDKTKVQAIKGYLKGGHHPKEVARKLLEHVNLKIPYDPLLRMILSCLIPPCYETSDSRTQKKIVILMSAMRDLRYNMDEGMHSKREMDLRNNTDLTYVLAELDLVLSELHSGLWSEVLAATSYDSPIRLESYLEWINLNAFIARLAASSVCWVGPPRVGYLCESFIQDDKVRDDPVIFNVSVSGAAQHMIYSASKVYESCKQDGTLLQWQEWKDGFEKAQTNLLIDSKGKKHAKLSVAAMDNAELAWKRRHMERRNGRAILDWTQNNKEIQTIQVLTRGTKRGHDEAFSDSSAEKTEPDA